MKKKILGAVVCSVVAFGMVGCGTAKVDNNVKQESTDSTSEKTSSASVADLAAIIKDNSYINMPMDYTEEQLVELYSLDLENIEEYEIIETGISAQSGFVMFAKAKEGKVDEVKANVEAILRSKVASAFYPMQIELAEKAEVKVFGDMVVLMILNSEISEEATAKIEAALK